MRGEAAALPAPPLSRWVRGAERRTGAPGLSVPGPDHASGDLSPTSIQQILVETPAQALRGGLTEAPPCGVGTRPQRQVPGADEVGDAVAEAGLESVDAVQRMALGQLRGRWHGHQVIAVHAAIAQPAHHLPL